MNGKKGSEGTDALQGESELVKTRISEHTKEDADTGERRWTKGELCYRHMKADVEADWDGWDGGRMGRR